MSPEKLAKFHIVLMVFWVLVTPVTMKFPESVLWVAFMSQYANFVGHFASYDAARGEREMLAEIRELRLLVEGRAA